ncbi:hypothetical protein ACC732_37050, partial [Rhizobium ruizarguesonis]
INVVYVTHDQSEALTMSDRVCVFNDGILQQIAPPHALLLSAGKLVGSPRFEARHAHNVERAAHPLGDLGLAEPAHFQREG